MQKIKTAVSFLKNFVKRADMFLFVMCTICSIFGILMIRVAVTGLYEGGWDISTPTKFLFVQTFSMFLGFGAFILFTVIDADILGQNWKFLYVLIILLMAALFVLGQDDGTGNKSWIRFGGIGVQPSEVVKILYIVISAKQMTYLKEYKDVNSFWSLVQMAANFMVVFGLILVISSDLGSGTIIIFIFLIMLFSVGVKVYWFALGGAAVAAMIPLLWTYFLKDYQKKRLIAPYDPSVDPDGWGITWQTTQSKLSLASGRMTGVDSAHNVTVFTGKHTDFIFACVGETIGMIGCIIVIILLVIIIVHCFRVGLSCGRTYDMLICIGVTAAIFFQTFINIGMCIGITPVIGITLPFFSYGGSSMVTLYAAMGLVSGVKYKPKPQHFSLMY